MAKKKSASPTKPTKTEVAKMIVHDELGKSYRAIGRMLGRSNHTVKKYLNSEAYLKDPAVQELVTILKAKEIDELTLLGGKARARLHELLDEGKTKAIETTAIMDRCFQQRRLLSGESTHSFDMHQYVIEAREFLVKIQKEREQIEEKLNEGEDS